MKKEKAETEEINTYRFQWEEIKRKEESKGKATVFLAGQDIETDIFRLLALIRNYRRKERRMVIVTENAVKVLPGDEVKGYRQAGLWGLVRCIRAERPDLEICLLDMDERGRIGDNGKYFSDGQDFSYVPEGEWEAAYRSGTLYGLRAVPVKERKDGRERHMQGITAVLTGASGGLAFPYALWMAAAGRKGSRLFPGRGQKGWRFYWKRWIIIDCRENI